MRPIANREPLGWFSVQKYQRIAGQRSRHPEVLAQLHRQRPDGHEAICRVFGTASRTACLIPRGSPVLMVAHVDTVLEPHCAAEIRGNRLYHTGLDNRLGVYLGLEVLPAMGLNVDLLLTTDEEAGCSTAALLRTRKQYNWMFSFDRTGADVVCYQYDCAPLTLILNGCGFRVGAGTYSCIAELRHLRCCGMNFGCGMFDYHGAGAYCDLGMLNRQLKRFAAFYCGYSGVLLEHRLPAGCSSQHVPVADLILRIPAEFEKDLKQRKES